MTQVCPKLAQGLGFWTKQSKILVLSEIRSSDRNFGHGDLKKKCPRDLKTSFLTI
jgi:hypothetical protein